MPAYFLSKITLKTFKKGLIYVKTIYSNKFFSNWSKSSFFLENKILHILSRYFFYNISQRKVFVIILFFIYKNKHLFNYIINQ